MVNSARVRDAPRSLHYLGAALRSQSSNFMFMSCACGDDSIVKALLESELMTEVGINQQDWFDRTCRPDKSPLFLSVVKGRGAIVKLLLEHPMTDVSVMDRNGTTAVWMAAAAAADAAACGARKTHQC